MNLMGVAEFAAKRRGEQDTLIEDLLPIITKALRSDSEDRWDELLQEIEDTYAVYFNREGGDVITRLDDLLRVVKAALAKIDEPLPSTARATAVAIAVGILNYSIMDAADDDPEPLVLEWVTMHDDAVRPSHKEAEGQQQPAGEKFSVGEAKMLAPGDMSAPIEEWINCRCVLAPAFGNVTAAISEQPWDGSASRFTDQQWKSSCIVHVCDGMEKNCHKVPIKEPGGSLSRAGVHAAAGRLNQVDAPPEKIASAKRILRGAYRQLGEEPPDSLTAAAGEDVDENEPDINMGDFAPMQWHGVIAPEEEWSGDGRMFKKDSLSFREFPLPLTWQKASADGHDGSVVVGSIDGAERRDDGLVHGWGTFLPTPEADEVLGIFAHFGRFGVSVDADDIEAEFAEDDDSMRVVFSKARICSASVVPIPAFPSAWVALGPEEEAMVAAVDWDWDSTFKHWNDYGYTTTGGTGTWTLNIPRVAGGGSAWSAGTGGGGGTSTFGTGGGGGGTATFKRGPGWVTHPEDTRRIWAYWTKKGQPGYQKINWGVPGDFNRCRVLVGEKIAKNSPEDLRFLNNICAQWHHDALGFWPGRAPSEQVALEMPEAEEAPGVSLVAASPIVAPSEWFADPQFTEPTPLTITPDGRVSGHIAVWGTCHMGFDNVCVEPPPSSYDYAYFMTGAVLTDQGDLAVGHLTIGGGHAPLHMRAREAASYYDKTSAAWADVAAGDDEHGIWVAGWVRPGVTEEQVVAARASAPSGDWRNIAGSLELIAAHSVNSPGYPVVRVAAGVQEALIASADIPTPDATETIVDQLAEKVAAALEARQTRREEMAQIAASLGEEE